MALVVKRGDLQPRGCRFESWRRILDGMLVGKGIIFKKRNEINVAN